jgi:hypothetical protein
MIFLKKMLSREEKICRFFQHQNDLKMLNYKVVDTAKAILFYKVYLHLI